ncbi:fatty-acid--CoA ligase FadD8 [Hoyosella subflava]|uniref:Fatty-acyl-CoA synthase n=1 Tax=Hoyosella subflava (strain DSM 45089 / JCM 17490 / NBRC 109087 / DQS3-9A1) TaxID=443218 RepID=F6EN68_HOYSD|nr:fatty-acid--CoA ligase FadD8 [Hoyosella subflava]AEF39385.1 Fatty-acyl-CoA synthase [Hoyosella subflava DQS3-9A1]
MIGDTMRQPVHLGHVLIQALNRHREGPVLELGEIMLTGQETAAQISQYAQAFDDLGMGTGAPVALLSLNRPEVLLTIGAGQILGSRRTALHPLGSVDDHAFVLSDAAITHLIIDPIPMFVQRAVELLDAVPTLRQIVTLGPVPEELKGTGARDLTECAATYTPQPLKAADLPPDHVVSITYTGGTTGKPKGVIGTAQSILTMTQVQLAEWEWPEAPRFLICTPLSHAGAAFFAPTLIKGGSLVVLPKFDPAEVLRTIEEQRITATMLVPTMLYALLDHPDSHKRDLSSLQTVYYGAAAINPVRLREAIERFGPIFAQYYGQSEAPMAITYLAKDEHDEARLTSCGRPSAFLKTALLDADGQPVPTGSPGEICVAGPLLAAGYLNRPEATAETFRDDWLHTGDVAKADEDGFWYIVDRIKDMIVTGGFNVFPREVEDVIATHPAVAQVAVVGVSDEKWGEAVTAVVVLHTGAVDGPRSGESVIEEIKSAVRKRKGPVHEPKHVILTDSLPVTPLGKPDKKALRSGFQKT